MKKMYINKYLYKIIDKIFKNIYHSKYKFL